MGAAFTRLVVPLSKPAKAAVRIIELLEIFMTYLLIQCKRFDPATVHAEAAIVGGLSRWLQLESHPLNPGKPQVYSKAQKKLL
jgi:hypothetical protein